MKKIIAIMACIALLCMPWAFAEGFDTEIMFDEEAQSVTVASFEEAADVYEGELPALEAPEGFSLQEILVDEFGLTAYYESADAAFEMNVYDYGDVEGLLRFGLENGALTDPSGVIVEVYEEDGMITSADVYGPRGTLYFYFEGMDLENVKAVLAGITL